MRIRDPTDSIVYFTGFTWSLFIYLIQTLFEFTRTKMKFFLTSNILHSNDNEIIAYNTDHNRLSHHLSTSSSNTK